MHKIFFQNFTTTIFIIFLGLHSIHAEDIQFPTDAGFNNVKTFGAMGDGKTDDTKAFQDAITATWPANDGGNPNNYKTLYIPNGTYLLSNTLNWSRWAIWQGESEALTVLKLTDNATGFGAGANKPLMRCYYSNNTTFDNHVANLTINTGKGNPGAIGFRYNNHNGGLVQNVTIKSEDGAGVIGLDLTENEFGPSLLRNITVDGFDKGVVTVGSVSHATFLGLNLKNQKLVGFENNLPVAIYGLTSQNSCLAIKNNNFDLAHLVLVNAKLMGGAGGPAIENNRNYYLKDIVTEGYTTALSDKGQLFAGKSISEKVNAETLKVFTSPIRHIGLPFIDIPPTFYEPIANWKTPATVGDMTTNVQAAMNSGASTIYFKFEQSYSVNQTIHIPATVKRIVGMYAGPGGNDGALSNKDVPLLKIEGVTSEPLVIERLASSRWPYQDAIDIEVASARPVVIWSGGATGTIRTAAGFGGNLWLMDRHDDLRFFGPKNIFVMHWNPENNPYPRPIRKYCINDAANLWLLGIKTEAPAIHLETINKGRSDVYGGFFRDHLVPVNGDTVPFFITTNASISATYFAYDWSGGGNSRGLQASETRAGVKKDLVISQSSHAVGLYSGYDSLDNILSIKKGFKEINSNSSSLKANHHNANGRLIKSLNSYSKIFPTPLNF